jgi:Cyclin, N-terminal domain/Cyclin, C-terminal domain
MDPYSTEQTLQTIQAMRCQEETAYGVSDYLSCIPPKVNCALDTPVDASCRFVMAKWCCEIADFCKYKRETVAVAMNCLDRFMATPVGQQILLDRNLYQLASMTALYSCVKIHEQEAMDPNLISSLSRGVHSPKAVEEMEATMLKAIQWRVNPPTAMSFVRSLMDLVPHHIVGVAERETITEITKFQIELAVNEYKFSGFQASSIAFASLLNSVESLSEDCMFFANFENTMSCTVGIDIQSVRGLRIALYELMNGNDTIVLQNTYVQTASSTKTDASVCGEPINTDGYYKTSPRSVSI